MAVPIVDNALKVISEGIKYLTLLTKTAHVRRLRKAVDYGEDFILLYNSLKETNSRKKGNPNKEETEENFTTIFQI